MTYDYIEYKIGTLFWVWESWTETELGWAESWQALISPLPIGTSREHRTLQDLLGQTKVVNAAS